MSAITTEARVPLTTEVVRRDPVAQAFLIMRIAFTVAPILFGLDKFVNVLTDDWTRYLSSEFNDIIPGSAATAMHIVGIVEIAAGLVVAVIPRFGGLLVAGWLAGIILNLLLVGGYGDVAFRDFGLLLTALTLTRLASAYPGGATNPARRRPIAGHGGRRPGGAGRRWFAATASVRAPRGRRPRRTGKPGGDHPPCPS